eukprot:11225280-Lingulodinium_polyedra.AAC.1
MGGEAGGLPALEADWGWPLMQVPRPRRRCQCQSLRSADPGSSGKRTPRSASCMVRPTRRRASQRA